jgi:paraquat-inducible protein B
VNLNVFIRAPYDDLVQDNSRFWNSSGFDLSLGVEGITAHMESLATLVSGGIAFDTPRTLSTNRPAPEGKEFFLYQDNTGTNEMTPSLKLEYVLYFEESLKGLNVDAPVEFRGTTVGKVLSKETRIDPISLNVQMPILIELYPERLSLQDDAVDPAELIEDLVAKGLKGSLKTGNLLTGQVYIELEFDEKDPPGEIRTTEKYARFPTAPGQFEQVTRSFSNLVSKLEKLPLNDIMNNLNDTITEAKQLVAAPENKQTLKNLETMVAEMTRTSQKLSQLANTVSPKVNSTFDSADEALQQLGKTLAQMETTLSETAGSFSEDSAFQYKLRILMDELTVTSRSVNALVDTLQRKPDALIFGK